MPYYFIIGILVGMSLAVTAIFLAFAIGYYSNEFWAFLVRKRNTVAILIAIVAFNQWCLSKELSGPLAIEVILAMIYAVAKTSRFLRVRKTRAKTRTMLSEWEKSQRD